MVEVTHLYLDDSGTRHPDRQTAPLPHHGYDWFALGGVLIDQEDENNARMMHSQFMDRWNLDASKIFLHSSEIRNCTGPFTWLAGSSDIKSRFMDDLGELLRVPRFLGIACVIHRPGYDARYREKYGRQQWSLCKTAFSVVVERSAKLAERRQRKLKVFVEKSDRLVDGWVKGYYDHLRTNGMPFSATGMQHYDPLSASELYKILYDFKIKGKTSPIMQIADLYLWAMAIGGYHCSNRAYNFLKTSNKLVDCHLDNNDVIKLGIKYSCFENVSVKP